MTDWDAIEHEWRFSTASNRALAAQFEVSEAAIRKRAKAEDWQKGVEPGPRQPARTKTEAAVPPPKTPPAERTLESATTRALDLAHRMLDELDTVTGGIDEIEDAIYEDTGDDRDGRRRSAMMKAVSLPSRTNTLKTIQQSLEALQILLARQQAGSGQGTGKKGAKLEAAKSAANKFASAPAPRHLRAVP